MTAEKPPVNYNDPRSHYMLEEFLSVPDKYAELNSRVLDRFRASLAVIETMPEGDGRITLLRMLNSALSDAQRRKTLHAENQVLTEQLKAQAPALAEINSAASKIKVWVRMLHEKFNKCYESEEKKGIDMWKTLWPWYDHELHVYTPAIVREIETLARATQVQIQPEVRSDA